MGRANLSALWAMMVIWGCAGCTSGPSAAGGSGKDALGEGVGKSDLPSLLPDTGKADAGKPTDTSLDLGTPGPGAGDVPDAGADLGTEVPPVFEKCTSSEDCDSGFCIDGPDGDKVCSVLCVEKCPDGWQCSQVQTTSTDTIFICLPRWRGLCRPCLSAGDCPTKGSTCHAMGDAGHFCATPCKVAADCPPDYACDGTVCTRLESKGECPCDVEGKQLGSATHCATTNAAGQCKGKRGCGKDGLSACDAKVPVAELCNGMDDDCDGSNDEDTVGKPCEVKNDHGACPGTSTCDGATAGCKGQEPEAELCDGKDQNCDGKADESFDDTDQDSTADCVDEDDDNDTILDVPDNCPVQANTGQEDHDLDGKGDVCDPDDDADTIGDEKDNCPLVQNTSQDDLDLDGQGDACDSDKDGDGVDNDKDNCPIDANADQADLDQNGIGDECSGDKDGDGVPDAGDNCPKVKNADQLDSDQDGVGNVCDDDDDGDLDPDVVDCAPLDATASHTAAELCNVKDDDCDGQTDEVDAKGCAVFYLDADKDTFGQSKLSQCLCVPSGDYTAIQSGDCNDGSTASNPLAPEVCDGIDNDCDTTADELGALGCTVYYTDQDKDTFGLPGSELCQCTPTVDHPTAKGGDCDDLVITTNPGGTETCGGKDENCNMEVDEEGALFCKTFFRDVDGDTWGVQGLTKCLCLPSSPYSATQTGDCDDSTSTTSPVAAELCDGADNNCNTLVDEGSPTNCTLFFVDNDGDGFGANGGASVCKCQAIAPFSAVVQGDCNDGTGSISPVAPEICNGKDDNCNTTADEGMPDTDGDGTKDCLDSDDDNDGTPDAQDCQPLNSAIPSCLNKDCGDDGCGKSCGSCPGDFCQSATPACMALGRCQSIVNPDLPSSTQNRCTPCGNIDYKGVCWGSHTVVWCEAGALTSLTCSIDSWGYQGVCLWLPQYQWYDCSYN